MKSAIPFLVLLAATAAFAGWSSSGPTGGVVNAVVVAPSDSAVIWAGNAAGVYRSADGGVTWANVSGPVVDVDFLAVHPNDPSTAWALCGTNPSTRLFKTRDGGMTWQQIDALAGIRPAALLVDPAHPDVLYAGSQCGAIGFAGGAAPRFHETAGVYKSEDGGTTWRASNGGLSGFSLCVEELSLDPFSPWRLFLKNYAQRAPVESYDAGATWEVAEGARGTRAIVIDPRFPFTHYGITAGAGETIVVTQDGGFTWAWVGAAAPAEPFALSIDPARSRLFLGTDKGLFRSGNGGTVWAKTNAPEVPVQALAFSSASELLVAGTEDGLLAIPQRGLGLPQRIDVHDSATIVFAIAIDPSSPEVVYAGTRMNVSIPTHDRVFRSADSGGSWERVPGDTDDLKSLYMTVDAAGTLYAAGAYGPLYRRARDAKEWTKLDDLPAGGYGLIADPKTPGKLFVTGLYRSLDGGQSWQELPRTFGITSIAIDPNDPRRVYAGSDYVLLGSDDGGDTWETIEPFQPLKSGTRGIVVSPADGRVLYRIGSNGGAPRTERSDDRGATWTAVPLPGKQYPTDIAADPLDAHSVWSAGFNGSLYHSTDGGATWVAVDGPFVTAQPAAVLRIDPTGHLLYVSFTGHGVWQLTLR